MLDARENMLNRHFWLLVVLLVLLTIIVLNVAYGKSTSNVVLRILRPYEKNPQHEIWVQPMLPAYFTFQVESGKLPESGILACQQVEETRKSPDKKWTYHVIVLHCGKNRILVLTGVVFE